jgi:sec-independent protein translocase protein TatA
MFSGLESPMHLVIVLIVAVLVLGPKKLPEVGRSLGSGIRQFKHSIEGHDSEPTTAAVAATPVAAPAPVVASAPVAAAAPTVAPMEPMEAEKVE